MRDVWGLADNTRRKRCRVVGGFLVEHFGEQPISLATVNAASIRRFVLGKQGRRPTTVAAIGVIIGCYLRFRSMSGDRVSELKAAIPRVAHWRLASLPEVLTGAEIDELLSSFDQAFPSRLQAYAMVRCLIDLGLRSSIAAYLHEERPATSTGPYLFAMLPPTTSRSRRRASNAQCWPATDDVDGRGPVSRPCDRRFAPRP
ncbi:hypothetical protein NKH81_32945 [Mesorhizobium sp. M0959]|uniref:hypothetical protein n=1 Tax=Mesorhizobium sp. M0959 TaxID=2957034 RepID=UPI00333C32F5